MWEMIDGFAGYEVSDEGVVRNAKTGHVIAQFDNGRGYLKVGIKSSDDGKFHNVSVHRIVAKAFVINPDDTIFTQVNHINEDKHDNRASNLEWVTASENVNHGTGIKRRASSQSFPIVMHYKGLDVYFDSASDVEKRTGIIAQSVQRCCAGKMKTSHGATFEYVSGGTEDAD